MIKRFFNKLFKGNDANDAVSFKSSMDLTGLPIVTFYQGEKKLNFLLDTGATDSIIDSNVLESIEYAKSDAATSLMGIDGKKKIVPFCLITLSYNNKDYTFTYLANDMSEAFAHVKNDTGVSLHGIIGSNFFNKFKYVLDFNELIAYSKA